MYRNGNSYESSKYHRKNYFISYILIITKGIICIRCAGKQAGYCSSSRMGLDKMQKKKHNEYAKSESAYPLDKSTAKTHYNQKMQCNQFISSTPFTTASKYTTYLKKFQLKPTLMKITFRYIKRAGINPCPTKNSNGLY